MNKKEILKELSSLNDLAFRMVMFQFIGMNSDDDLMWHYLDKSIKSPIIIREIKV